VSRKVDTLILSVSHRNKLRRELLVTPTPESEDKYGLSRVTLWRAAAGLHLSPEVARGIIEKLESPDPTEVA
jgi:hypothetical protein